MQLRNLFLLASLLHLILSIEYIPRRDLLEDVDTDYQLLSFTNLINKSRYLDLVFTSPTHDSITVRSYNAAKFTYNTPAKYAYNFQHDAKVSNYKIIGALPADFNGDKTTDLMIVFSENGDDYKLAILWNKDESLSSVSHLEFVFSDVPHLIEYNGDLFVDFICSEGEVRYFYINDPRSPGTFQKIKITDREDEKDLKLDFNSGGTSYVFGDLNGDCAADLFTITKLNNGSHMFQLFEAEGKKLSLVWQGPVPEQARADKYGAPLIEDIDGNGKMDIVIAGCSRVSKSTNSCMESKVFVFYNDPCSARTTDKCKVYESDCTKYNFDIGKDLYVFDKFTHESSNYGFLNYAKTDIFSSKYLIRAADVDSDGHVDLIAVLKFDNSYQSVIFLNTEDSSGSVTGGRVFSLNWRDDLVLNSDQTATFQPYALAAVDALGVGTLQFFVIGRNSKNTAQFSISLLVTKENLDAFWIKVTVLCNKCDSSSTTMVGGNVFYYTTGYKGDPEVGYGSQNSLLAPFSLQAPYMLFGLGQQANYIEYIKVAYRNTSKENKDVDMNKFDQLIPNAQVFAIPMDSMWKLVMMVVPGKTLWQTLIVLGVCCLVCIVIILVLHIKEKKEDDREKRKFNAKFNFDAMGS